MSSFIKVNYNEFESSADAIETYISRQKANMEKAAREVSVLGGSWKGKDFESFKTKWSEMDGSGSTADNFAKSLESYAKVLRHAAKQYKEAQKVAINRANSL
ncbi:WXG100 family type VII secretion target [Bacillus sp. B-jedd]|uniref:WXG100 family type VII secretion target n=1 Tax=Bacillus sp. B-jedd TaxID=1476857 RepID=UPI000515560C|nr:WXG100 family type VII secretion target [Bacillus sp. B-jedd]CEG28515.1 Proteins of 100 residues with WXG [Bacillus sp. B-jedd]